MSVAVGVRVAGAMLLALSVVSCTNSSPSPSPSPDRAAPSSLGFDEAARRVPLDGTASSPITWEPAGAPESDEVLAARRSLAYDNWLSGATDPAPIIPVARSLFTDSFYRDIYAPYASSSPTDDPYVGPIWVKVMGVERTGADQARVTFCTDIGWWHNASASDRQHRTNRASLQSYVMRNVSTGDGVRHWLADRFLAPDVDRRPQYGAPCTTWARHQP